MRYASRLDYFLFNTLFRREGLRLSGFANGIRFWYYRPLRDALRTLRAPAARRAAGRRARARARVRRASSRATGSSLFLFLRTARLRAQLREPRGRASSRGASERDLLAEVVDVGAELGPARVRWCRSRCSGARVRARGGAS